MKTAVLIQTCDNYTHLWEGLQLSYHFNWCWDLDFPIYVLTEDKNFNEDKRFITLNFGYCGVKEFSTRLIKSLEYLKNEGFDSVFYTQDDFWPLIKVDKEIIIKSQEFLSNDSVDCIHINEYLPWYTYNLIDTDISICNIKVKKYEVPSMYHYNHQSSLWKIDELLKIQSPHEEPHENECRGTERAWILNPNYYFLNYSWYKAEFINNKGELLPTAQSYVRDWKWQLKW